MAKTSSAAEVKLSTHFETLKQTLQSKQYESRLNLDVTLRRREPYEVLWRGHGLQLNEVYAGSRSAVVTTSSDFRTGNLSASDVQRMTDIQLTDTERKNARDQLMERFAKELHQRMMEMF